MTRMEARQTDQGDESDGPESPLSTDHAKLQELLREHWGHDALRPLQLEAIEAILGGRDVMLVLPTGGGKSLCYQLPALLLNRPSVVISPLVSLMKDQVDALQANGINADALHGLMDPEERSETIRRYMKGETSLLYLAPERLGSGSLLQILRKGNPALIAIDEAHCISQWGHDFRPDYRRLALIREELPDVPVLACTATATPRVQEDVVDQLNLRNPTCLVGSVDRPNLVFRMRPRAGGIGQISDILKQHANEASIVYTLSRNDAERIAKGLRERGIDAAHYHAGMTANKRRLVHDRFRHDRLSVVVATVAFGMGIDRGDVRCVIHATMPRSLEHYQQEAGRAGRDGLEAECVLLHSPGDLVRWQKLMERSAGEALDRGVDQDEVERSLRSQQEQLRHMAGVCRTARCRHLAIAEYFGSESGHDPDDPKGCGACDTCLGEVRVMSDSTTVARMILSCVARVDQSFGAGHVAEVLSGGRGERVRRLGHDQLSTWGLLKAHGKSEVIELLEQCVSHGLLDRTPGDRPVLVLSPQGVQVLRGEADVDLVQPATRTRRPTGTESSINGADRSLFDALRNLRRELAAERTVPAYVIASDAVLRELARSRPSTIEAMGSIRGIGRKKMLELGPRLLAFLDEWCPANGLARDMVD